MRFLSACLLFAAAVANGATMTGWISDESCGASNAKGTSEARECAKNCIKNGSAAVFVSDADQKVYKLSGKDVSTHLDHKVNVTGDVKGDTLVVREIKKAD